VNSVFSSLFRTIVKEYSKTSVREEANKPPKTHTLLKFLKPTVNKNSRLIFFSTLSPDLSHYKENLNTLKVKINQSFLIFCK
jgi:hypothetical protein